MYLPVGVVFSRCGCQYPVPHAVREASRVIFVFITVSQSLFNECFKHNVTNLRYYTDSLVEPLGET